MRTRRNGTPITAEKLREILSYDPDTGEFRWKVRTSRRTNIGDVAGSLSKYGYNCIMIKKKHYFAHRLALLYTTGSYPKHEIDHINGNRVDNRINNICEVTRRENQCNRKSHRAGRLQGTSYVNRNQRWVAQIQIDGKHKHLGYFSSEEAAHHTYLIWKHNLGL